MRYYPFSDNKMTRFATGAFLFVLLLLARDTLITSCILGFTRSQFLMLGCIVLFGLGFLWANRRDLPAMVKDRRLWLVPVFAIVILLPMAVKRDWQLMYFSILLCLLVGVFFTFFLRLEDAAKYYLVILCGLGVYSVIATYLLRLLPDRGILQVPVVVNSSGWDFYNFGLSYVSITNSPGRNFGIFREPGVYQFFLLVGLYLNNYRVRWEKPSRLWLVNILLAVTMLSTFATGGVIEMALLAVVMFFEKQWYRDRRGRRIALALVVLAAAAVGIILLRGGKLAYELTGMVTKFFSNAESSNSRLESIWTDLVLFARHPFAGDTIAAVLHAVENNTTSTMILYAVLGVAGGTLNVLAWAALVWDKERKLWANAALLVILFMSFNTQNLTADVFFWLFPVMALTERTVPRLGRAGK